MILFEGFLNYDELIGTFDVKEIKEEKEKRENL